MFEPTRQAHNPKHRMLGPAATTTYCWPPTLNVMGDVNVSCLLDGYVPEKPPVPPVKEA